MKFAVVAAALALSSFAALAAQDPNVIAVTVPTTNTVVSPIPEADSVAMLVAGVAVVGGIAVLRRRKK